MQRPARGLRAGRQAWSLVALAAVIASACDRNATDRHNGLAAGAQDATQPGAGTENAGAGGSSGTAMEPGPGCLGLAGSETAAPDDWTEVAPPTGVTGFVATDAFAAAPGDLYFAGYRRDTPSEDPRGVVLRWNRGCWTTELAPEADSYPMLPSVHGTDPAHVFAAVGGTLYQRHPGGSWTAFDEGWKAEVMLPSPRPLRLTRVRALSPSELWVTEANAILHYRGGAWTGYRLDVGEPGQSASITMSFLDVWISGPNDVWVAAGSDQVGSTMDPAFLHHFDGTTWTSAVVARYGVTSIRPVDGSVWFTAPGNFGDVDADGSWEQVSIFRYDNALPSRAFSVADVSETAQYAFRTLWGRGPTDLWASGQEVAYFDGYAWSAAPGLPAAATGTNDEPVFVTGDPQSVWLVAPGPRFFRRAHE